MLLPLFLRSAPLGSNFGACMWISHGKLSKAGFWPCIRSILPMFEVLALSLTISLAVLLIDTGVLLLSCPLCHPTSMGKRGLAALASSDQ